MSKTVNESVLRALAKATMEARAGNVEAVAVIIASPSGAPTVSFAGESELMPTINIGADMLKNYVLAQVMVGLQQPASGLVRPAMDS